MRSTKEQLGATPARPPVFGLAAGLALTFTLLAASPAHATVVQRGFVWHDGVMYDIGAPAGAHGTQAWEINDSFLVAAQAAFSGSNVRAYIYDAIGDSWTAIPGLESWSQSYARAINSAGDVAGWGVDAAGERRAFLYLADEQRTTVLGLDLPAGNLDLAIDDERRVMLGDRIYDHASGVVTPLWGSGWHMQNLGVVGLSNSGIAVAAGRTNLSPYSQGAISYDLTTGQVTYLGTLPGGTAGAALGVNDAGDIVGRSQIPDGTGAHPHAFLHRGGVMTPLPDPVGFSGAVAYSISEDGTVVVGSSYGSAWTEAIGWFHSPGSGWTVAGLGFLAGGNYSDARDVNSSGWIVGIATTTMPRSTGGSAGGGGAPPVPEPGLLALAALGALPLVRAERARR